MKSQRADPLSLPRRLVALAGRLVPAPRRAAWLREWEAEMTAWWVEAAHSGRPGARFLLLRRAAASLADAFTVRRLARFSLPERPPEDTLMDALLHDLRFAVRAFARKPALTAVLLLTLGLGIGANTAIFSLLHGIVLAPMPYPEASELVEIWPARSRGLSKEMLVKLQEEAGSYQALAAWSEDAFKMRLEGRAEMVYGPRVTAGFFRVLGARPALGRLFQEGDDRRGNRSAVLSYDHWQTRYGGEPAVLGRVLELSGERYTVVGVVERGFDVPQGPFDLAVTHLVEADEVDYDANYLDFIGRLAPERTPEEADAEFRELMLRWADEEGVSRDWAETAAVVPLHEYLVGDVEPALYMLLGAVGLVLLIVIANVANLLLARALSREQEISVRAALGATRRRLARQLLTETTLLAVAGGALGVALAGWVLKGLVAVLPADTPRLETISIAPEVLGFSLALAVGTGLAVGLVPLVSALRLELRSGLGGGGRQASASPSRRRLRSSLVVAEVTLAVVLLASAGILIKSFWRTLQVDPGFEPAGLVRFTVLPGESSWGSAEELERYSESLRERLRAVAGVEDVATVHAVPVVNGGWVMGTYPVDDPPPEGEMTPLARWRPVSPEYFRLARIEVLAGRGFTAEDDAAAEGVVVLNRSAARAYFGDEAPLGRSVAITFEGRAPLRVVGVVEDVRILGLREEAPRAAYRPYAQAGEALHRIAVSQRSMVVRSGLPPRAMEGPLRAAVESVDPFANVLHLESMEDAIATSLAQPRVVTVLLAAFAGLALLLGAVGIYGVMGYTVGERTREMGIRLALGASAPSIHGTVMAGGLKLIFLGLVLGAGFGLLATKLLSSQLFEVSPSDPASLGAAAGVLLTAALVAIYLPARRAGRVDPVEVLRGD